MQLASSQLRASRRPKPGAVGLSAPIDERHQDQVAERQRVAIRRIGREPALQPVDEVERREQQEREPQRADEGEKTREPQCDAEKESGCRDFEEIDDEEATRLGTSGNAA